MCFGISTPSSPRHPSYPLGKQFHVANLLIEQIPSWNKSSHEQITSWSKSHHVADPLMEQTIFRTV